MHSPPSIWAHRHLPGIISRCLMVSLSTAPRLQVHDHVSLPTLHASHLRIHVGNVIVSGIGVEGNLPWASLLLCIPSPGMWSVPVSTCISQDDSMNLFPKFSLCLCPWGISQQTWKWNFSSSHSPLYYLEQKCILGAEVCPWSRCLLGTSSRTPFWQEGLG